MSLRDDPQFGGLTRKSRDHEERIRRLEQRLFSLAPIVKDGDHGSLLGLADDDHPQYTTAAEATAIADAEITALAILRALIDAKGDIVAGSAADTPAVLTVGADGLFLKADSTQPLGLLWAAVSSVLEVRDEGVDQGDVTVAFDFVGAGVTATLAGGVATITIPGGGGGGMEPTSPLLLMGG